MLHAKSQIIKPKYAIYLVLFLSAIFWFLHRKLIPDVQAKNIGTILKEETIKEKEFKIYGQLSSESTLEKHWMTEICFYDTTQLSKDIIFAVDCDDWSLKDISFKYSYELDGKEFVELLSDDDTDVQFARKEALGGIAIRQPFPKDAINRRLILYHTVENTQEGFSSLVYVAVGSQLHHCDMRQGVEIAVNAEKFKHFGKVEFFKFSLGED